MHYFLRFSEIIIYTSSVAYDTVLMCFTQTTNALLPIDVAIDLTVVQYLLALP